MSTFKTLNGYEVEDEKARQDIASSVVELNSRIDTEIEEINSTIDTKVEEINSRIDTEVEEINSNINKCEPTSALADLSPYNSVDKFFTFTSDGYVRVNSFGTNTATIHTVNGFYVRCTAGQHTALFFKKGARVYCEYTDLTSLHIHYSLCV